VLQTRYFQKKQLFSIWRTWQEVKFTLHQDLRKIERK